MISFCSLLSGSSGNCIFVRSDDTKILIDAGVSGKKVADALRKIGETPESLSAIFVTHEHSDHVLGVGILSRKYNLPIYANEMTWRAMEQTVKKILPENRKEFASDESIKMGELIITPFAISHDAVQPNGYTIENGGRKLAIATDTGIVTETVRASVLGSDAVLLEANHDIEMLRNGAYSYQLKQRIAGEHGHLSNVASAEFAIELVKSGTKKILLGHLSRENNTPEIAYNTVKNILLKQNIEAGRDVDLSVAPRYEAGKIIEV